MVRRRIGRAMSETSLDPADWDRFRRLLHDAVDGVVDDLAGVRDEPAWRPVPDEVKAALREPLPRARRAARDDGRALRRADPAVSDREPASALLRLGARRRQRRRRAGRAARGRDERERRRPRARRGVRRARGRRVVRGAVRVSARRERRPDERHVDGQPARGRRGARRRARRRCARRRDRRRAAHRVRRRRACTTRSRKRCASPGSARRRCARSTLDDAFGSTSRRCATRIDADRAGGSAAVSRRSPPRAASTPARSTDSTRSPTCAPREKLWLHVDGAFGALAIASPAHAHLVAGIERADSLAFDAHKWLHAPYAVGCVLFRDERAHRAAFASAPAYLGRAERGYRRGRTVVHRLRARALARVPRAQSVVHAAPLRDRTRSARRSRARASSRRALAERVRAAADLELLAPVTLNVVCFRYRPPGLMTKRR